MARRNLAAVGLLAVVALCGAVFVQGKTLYRKASAFTTIVVTENEGNVRTLWFGDGDAPQSVVKLGDPDFVELEYAQAMPVAMALVEEPKRALIVGLGGGTIPSLLHKHYPKMTIDVVDIDPDVVEVAKKFFGFREDTTLRVHVEDGRRFIERCKEPYDIVFLDAYGADNIPYDLATKEFLQATRRAVKPKGLVAANVWSSSCNALHDDMLRTYQDAFDDVYVIVAGESGNEIFLALPRRERIERGALAARASRISREKKLRFDMGSYVRLGFMPAREKDPGAKVLLDRDKMPEVTP